MSVTIILIIASCGLGVVLLGKSFAEPAKLFKKVIINSLLGVTLLWLINTMGTYVGLTIPLNFFTVLVTGVLGLPGVAMLGMLQVIVK